MVVDTLYCTKRYILGGLIAHSDRIQHMLKYYFDFQSFLWRILPCFGTWMVTFGRNV